MDSLRTPAANRHSLPEPGEEPGQARVPKGRAVFSPCHRYRWWLERQWDPRRATLIFIGLNPSRADGRQDDPTLRRLVGFARGWGFGALEVLNLFARITASPALLRRCEDPVGDATDGWIKARLRAQGTPVVWLGWGNQGAFRGRDREVLALLENGRASLVGLGRTRADQPRHPLYCPATLPLLPLAPSCGERPDSGALPCPASPVATPSTCS